MPCNDDPGGNNSPVIRAQAYMLGESAGRPDLVRSMRQAPLGGMCGTAAASGNW